MHTTGWILTVLALSCVWSVLVQWKNRSYENVRLQNKLEVEDWLQTNGLEEYKSIFWDTGYEYLEEFASVDVKTHPKFQHLDFEVKIHIDDAIHKLGDKFLMKEWLEGKGLEEYLERLIFHGYTSLSQLADLDLSDLDVINTLHITFEDFVIFRKDIKEIKQARQDIEFRSKAWREYVRATKKTKMGLLSFIMTILASVVTVPLFVLIIWCKYAFNPSTLLQNLRRPVRRNQNRTHNRSFLNYITGSFLDQEKCTVEWGWKDTAVVGQMLTFTAYFYRKNGSRYPISTADNVSVDITHRDIKINPTVELGSQAEKPHHTAKVTFTVHKAGTYTISVMVGGVPIKGSPFDQLISPGKVEAANTAFLQHSSTIVVTQGEFQELAIEPRDEYGNVCDQKLESTFDNQYDIQVTEIGDTTGESFSPVWQVTDELRNKIMVHIKMPDTGCYEAKATYQGKLLKNGEFNIIVLSGNDAAKVKKNVAKKNFNIWYEAYLRGTNNERHRRPKKVYCYISPRQLTIKEYYWKIIPKRLYTFRVCPSTKFQFGSINNECGLPMFTIDDGTQPPIDMASKERDILAATFTQFLLKNIGGSETFQDKQEFFFQEVRHLHNRRSRSKLTLSINRFDLLDSSIRATKHFSTNDWCKNFQIEFVGEEGLDWGGVRREWFEVVSDALFSPEKQLFKRFKDDNQALVHPNQRRPTHLAKLKFYEFAGKIVGKCLYESAMGQGYRQLVKARFTRSFLAQLIGLRVNFKYFETDDPDTYVTKIKYIQENDVDDLDLVFAEEEYNENGSVDKIVELITDGANISVTNQNKMQYLDLLAQYKLSTSVENEIEHFQKGLNELIPDHLLSIFDENELELLMCGSSSFDVDDFKKNCVINCGGGYAFARQLGWFWTVVTGFSQDDMARLLQFTTGCSQLPPGGFAELVPKFQISAAPTYGNLPTAHTCFNQLCLPLYDSLEHLQRSLLVAINEGSEGFGIV
ncbi:apoptosis-resistant E3 ubiquitin protein ligase 1-like [Glandiceps talaboti]